MAEGSYVLDPVRQEVLALAHTIVVKVGTNVITDEVGALDLGRLARLAEQIHRIRQAGRRVVLVSSGAIGAGVGRLGLKSRPKDLRGLQAAAAVGQSVLMARYEEQFGLFGYHAAQILLTAGDFDDRNRYLNVRNTLHTLFELNCIPIINENDTVSVAEIRFGDNDHLAALVTNLLQAPLLILLTVVDGLYTADPGTDASAKFVSTVSQIDEAILQLAGARRSALGTGGMGSKLRAARLATAAGECVIIANGSKPGILDDIMSMQAVGTLFLPQGGTLAARKRWIGLTAQPQGKIFVDAGARDAVARRGGSLLAIGVVRIAGIFEKGDVVSLADADGAEFARGLTNYSSADLARIAGLRSDAVADVLQSRTYDEVVHRDNLAVVG
jgi:glutamate 5-kinase